MTKLIVGFCLIFATAGSCFQGKESNETVVKDSILVDETTVEISDDYSIPDLTIEYKSQKAFDKLKELRAFLDNRLEKNYPNETDRLYEYYHTQRDTLIKELNYEHMDFLDAYSQTYNVKTQQYELNESLKSTLKQYSEIGLRMDTDDDHIYLENAPDYYYNVFKDVSLSEEYKAFIKLQLDGKDVYNPDDFKPHVRLGEYLISWEQFLVKYSESDLYIYEEARRIYKETALLYLIGADPTFYFDDNLKMKSEFKKSFEYLKKKYPKSVTAKLINVFFENVKNNENIEIWPAMKDELSDYFQREP